MVSTNKGLFSGVKNLLSAGAKSKDGRTITPAVSMLKKTLFESTKTYIHHHSIALPSPDIIIELVVSKRASILKSADTFAPLENMIPFCIFKYYIDRIFRE